MKLLTEISGAEPAKVKREDAIPGHVYKDPDGDVYMLTDDAVGARRFVVLFDNTETGSTGGHVYREDTVSDVLIPATFTITEVPG